jgi:probable rRNA maturation factor
MKIGIQNLQKHTSLDLRRIRRAAKQILTLLDLPEAELSLLLVDDPAIRELNRDYLRKDKPTNVIAFPMGKGEFASLHPHLLGDIVISVETALRQSPRFGLRGMEMVLFLLTHGILHLIGYEHVGSRREARAMAARQNELFQGLSRKAHSRIGKITPRRPRRLSPPE